MHVSILASIFLSLLQTAKPGEIEQIKRQWQDAHAKAKGVYERLSITTTHTSLGTGMKSIKAIASDHDHLKLLHYTEGSDKKYYELLSRKFLLTMAFHEPTQLWQLYKCEKALESGAFEKWRRALWRGRPSVLDYPFETMIYSITVEDIFNGETSGRSQPGKTYPIAIDRIERVSSQDKTAYCVHFTLRYEPDGRNLSGSVTLAPHLCWMITKGDFGYTSKWEIEYGAVIHDVPVVKRAMYRGWNGKEVVPVHESTVEKAEEYLDVNESEYEPSTYDFDISSERKTINTILLIVMAIAGIFCVSNVIMLTIRAKRRVRSVSAKPIRTIPPA